MHTRRHEGASMRFRSLWIVFAAAVLLAATRVGAQCPPGRQCTEYLGEGPKGAFFRILVPEDWDGDIFLVNHGLELSPLTIAPHNTCRGDRTTACTTDADCTAILGRSCN